MSPITNMKDNNFVRKLFYKDRKTKQYCDDCKDIYYKEWKIGFFATIFLIALLIGLIFVGLQIKYDDTHKIQHDIFIKIPSIYNDKSVDTIADECNKATSTLEKIICVKTLVNLNYNYEDNLHFIHNPSHVIGGYGGVCRDYSVTYKAILDEMGIENDYLLTDTHIFNVIITDEYYVELDLDKIDFYYYDKGKVSIQIFENELSVELLDFSVKTTELSPRKL